MRFFKFVAFTAWWIFGTTRVACKERKPKLNYMRHRYLGEEDPDSLTTCKLQTKLYTQCSQQPKPLCTPFRSPDFCPLDESFPSLIQRRTEHVRDNAQSTLDNDGHFFHLLEDKVKAYLFTTQVAKVKAPTLLYCGDNVTEALLGPTVFAPPSTFTGFVIRATNMHSGQGVYVLPDGFGGIELLRGMTMTAADIALNLIPLGPEKIIIEEYIPGQQAGYLPTEYKVHVIDGKVESINVIYHRGCSCWAEVDTEWNRLDKYGCFVPSGLEMNAPDVNGQCHDIDFNTGAMKSYPIKGLDLCDEIEQACIDDIVTIAQKVGKLIGAYVRIDMFVSSSGEVIIQEYTTNHMGGTRHCSAKKASNDENSTCVNSCFLGQAWKDADPFYGGPTPSSITKQAFVDEITRLDSELCGYAVGKIPQLDGYYVPICPSTTTTPVAITVAPVPATSAPLAITPAPIVITPAPVAATPAPLAVTPAPVAITPAPLAFTPAPVAATPAPVAITPAPVALTSAPTGIAPPSIFDESEFPSSESSTNPLAMTSDIPSLSHQPTVKSSSVPSLSQQPTVKSSSVPSLSQQPTVKSSSVPSLSHHPTVTRSSIPSLSQQPSGAPTCGIACPIGQFLKSDCTCSTDPCDACPVGSLCNEIVNGTQSFGAICLACGCGYCDANEVPCCRRQSNNNANCVPNTGMGSPLIQGECQGEDFFSFSNSNNDVCSGQEKILLESLGPVLNAPGCGCQPSRLEVCAIRGAFDASGEICIFQHVCSLRRNNECTSGVAPNCCAPPLICNTNNKCG